MKPYLQNEALELSKRILEEWFAGNSELFIQHLGKKVSWIGSLESQFFPSKEQVLAAVERVGSQVLPCTLSDQFFFVADSGPNYCLCVGRYVCTLDQKDMFMSEPQRVSFLWKMEDKELRITHLHLSNTMAAVEPGEEFPVKASRQNYEYVQKKLNEYEDLVSFITTKGTKFFLTKYEIQYLKAKKDYIQIYTKEDEYHTVHAVFSKFIEQNFSDFLQIHRSIVVNPRHLSQVKNGKATLRSGIELPIARSHYKEVKASLQ